MSAIRAIKRKARRDLHERARVPAIFISDDHPNGVALFCRIHTKNAQIAMDAGSRSQEYVSRIEATPKLLFMLADLADAGVVLTRTGLISVQSGEAYELISSEPVDDISVTWVVTALSPADAADLPVPEDSDA